MMDRSLDNFAVTGDEDFATMTAQYAAEHGVAAAQPGTRELWRMPFAELSAYVTRMNAERPWYCLEVVLPIFEARASGESL